MKLINTFFLLFLSFFLNAQDTFSIVAIDEATGEIGSAGASCLDNVQFPGSNGAYIISDIIPGRGAIHTQAAYSAGNQNNAHAKMLEGLSAQEIVDWLRLNDANLFNASTRQYGVVDIDDMGNARAAAHTGQNCFDYKAHIVGPNYAIQGNILLGQAILDSMEARFLSTTGTLADKLMAALQGANVPGADTRCLDNGTSSLSAFLRVAKPTDDADAIFLDLNVPSLPAMQEPIDSLQTLYDAFVTSSGTENVLEKANTSIFPNPSFDGRVYVQIDSKGSSMEVFSLQGEKIKSELLTRGQNVIDFEEKGIFLVRIIGANNQKVHTYKIILW